MNRTPDGVANAEAIEATAAAWLVQKEEGFTPEQAAEFADWRNANPRHAAALAVLEQTCGILEKMPLLQADPRMARELEILKRVEPVPARAKIARFPAVVAWAAALAACLIVAAVLWSRLSDRVTFAHAYATASGGFQRVVLPDASVLELNADTEIRVQYTRSVRRLVLVQGEAHFSVEKNPARPFIVAARQVAVRAVGTAFNVRMHPTGIEVLVTEGQVAVSSGSGAATSAAGEDAPHDAKLCRAGERLELPNDNTAVGAIRVTSVDPATLRAALEWQAPQLVFVDTPLSEVVERFNRYNRVQLSVGDPELGRRTVGGTFHADQVEVFVRLLVNSRDVVAEQSAPDRIVLRRVGRTR